MEAVLKKEIIINKTLCRFIGVSVFVILTSLGAFVRIPLPFTPVPLTLQTFFILLCGAFLGSRLGVTAQLSYVFLGVLGLPVFTGASSGLGYLCGPTGGYIFGFILAVLFIGRFIKSAQNNLISVLAVLFLGDLILLLCGAVWLKFLLGITLGKSLLIGFLPFIPGDLLKALVASGLYLKLKKRIREVF